jgi:hypothetical protein
MTTIGESISRVRGIIKGVQEDAFLPDRFIYSIISKYAKLVLKREDAEKKLMRRDELFEMLPFVELESVSKIEANCAPIEINCTIQRTAVKLPQLFNGITGPLIRKVYSIDGSAEFEKTTPSQFLAITQSTSYKYNTAKHYWFRNGYLYFPNWDGEGIMVDGLWDGILDGFCRPDEDQCLSMQERLFPLPEDLFADVEKMAEAEFGISIQIPSDGADNGQNVLR